MERHSDDLVRVATGDVIEIRAWSDILLTKGILYRVVGDPAAARNTASPNAVELWVHRADLEVAVTAMADHFHNSLDDTEFE